MSEFFKYVVIGFLIFVSTLVDAQSKFYQSGRYEYECVNHLGNVLETVSDKKIRFSLGFHASVIFFTDYYPYGMQMMKRNATIGSYRYGFNGTEKDEEIKGTGNNLNFGMRLYAPRLGRFLSTDPLENQYSSYSSYLFAGNKPIHSIDLKGESEFVVVRYMNSDGIHYKSEIHVVNASGNTNNTNTYHYNTVTFQPGGAAVVEYNGSEEVVNIGQGSLITAEFNVINSTSLTGNAVDGNPTTMTRGVAPVKVGSTSNLDNDPNTLPPSSDIHFIAVETYANPVAAGGPVVPAGNVIVTANDLGSSLTVVVNQTAVVPDESNVNSSSGIISIPAKNLREDLNGNQNEFGTETGGWTSSAKKETDNVKSGTVYSAPGSGRKRKKEPVDF